MYSPFIWILAPGGSVTISVWMARSFETTVWQAVAQRTHAMAVASIRITAKFV
jgi:hypothetical protein